MIMKLLNTIQMLVTSILFFALAINFFYQVVKGFRTITKINYSEETFHTFKCRKCEEVYQINGEKLQAETSIWSTRMEIKTPTGQSNAIKFNCPQCHKKAFQEKVYDTDITAMAGNIRAQFDHNSQEVLIDILVKGFGPIIIGAFLIRLIS